jgi:hypothetical protein
MKTLRCLLLVAAVSSAGSLAVASDAVLVLVDRSASMNSSSKWTLASQGIVQALDQDEFDALDVGLISAPSGSIPGPQCVFGLPVPCQAPAFPQEAIAPAGPKSSVGPGTRRAIRDWMAANPPDGGSGDGLPLYAALQAGISALNTWTGTGHRILIVVTDGGIGCGQLSSRPGYGDCNGCDHEWESPNNIVGLVAQAAADASKPIDTFVIGVPGAESYDASGCNQPPYHMRLALSAIAAAGSEHVPANCTGLTFTQGGGDPTVACHTDLTQGNFSAGNLASAIALARQSVDDPIFRDGFESGDTLAWSARATDGGDLSVSAAAALASTTMGLQGAVNDTAALYVQDDTPSDEGHYRARFNFATNGFDPGEALNHRRVRIFIAFQEAPTRRLVAIVLRRVSGQYAVMGRARLDDNSQHDTGFFPITDGAHVVELHLVRSSGPDASDGQFELWIDGTSMQAATGLDNSASGVDFVRLGALSVKDGASGTLSWDEFESRRSSYIGP